MLMWHHRSALDHGNRPADLLASSVNVSRFVAQGPPLECGSVESWSGLRARFVLGRRRGFPLNQQKISGVVGEGEVEIVREMRKACGNGGERRDNDGRKGNK
ncbi:hypothetical protein M8J75_015133 [Diaphorina citri]|nr:hypothetical protein M8J75_015133 [Diaphorina citri]